MGIFRVNIQKYNHYYIYFEDLSGLSKKSDVKIAGVKVGWVDNINLLEGCSKARVKMFVNKNYKLKQDAYAEIRQEGLLGSKYLEVIPGSSLSSDLSSGVTLSNEGRSQVSVEELLHKVKNIADNIEVVTGSLKSALSGGPDEKNNLKALVENLNEASYNISKVTQTVSDNNENINNLLKNLSSFSDRLDGDINSSLQRATDHISSIAKKIDQGDGFIGQLVNDRQVFDDIKSVTTTLRAYSELADQTELVVDSHWESMYRPAEFYPLEDSKGYIDMRLHTSEDKFYLFEVVSSVRGNLQRRTGYYEYFNEDGQIVGPNSVGTIPGFTKEQPLLYTIQPPEVRVTTRIPNSYKFGFQFGKIFTDLALRFGIIENTAGFGIDYEIPFKSDKFRWVTSFEAFDLRGQDRIDDTRPHFKWINRIFVMNNLYLTFGADDFISRRNANAFFGGGLRFNDDDLKAILTKIGGFAGALVSTGS